MINDLFMVLMLLSLVGLVLGLLKPSLIKIKSRQYVFYIFGGLTFLFFILFGLTSGPTSISTPDQTTQTSQTKNSKPKTIEEKIADAINTSLGTKTNTGKPRVVAIEIDKYNTEMLSAYEYQSGATVLGLLIKMNADENLTINLQKGTMHNEAIKIAQAVFPIDQTIGDIIIWSQLPVKDQYGNVEDDTAIIYSISRTLFNKIDLNNFNHRDLPSLLKSENNTDARNNYFENINF